MVEFRCWYCNRKHAMPQKGIGKTIHCSCGSRLRVPRYSGGKCRIKTLADWAVEAVVYGGGGALICGGLAFLFIAALLPGGGFGGSGAAFFEIGWIVIAVFTAIGFVFGLVFGERGIGWIGRLIRGVESDDWWRRGF